MSVGYSYYLTRKYAHVYDKYLVNVDVIQFSSYYLRNAKLLFDNEASGNKNDGTSFIISTEDPKSVLNVTNASELDFNVELSPDAIKKTIVDTIKSNFTTGGFREVACYGEAGFQVIPQVAYGDSRAYEEIRRGKSIQYKLKSPDQWDADTPSSVVCADEEMGYGSTNSNISVSSSGDGAVHLTKLIFNNPGLLDSVTQPAPTTLKSEPFYIGIKNSATGRYNGERLAIAKTTHTWFSMGDENTAQTTKDNMADSNSGRTGNKVGKVSTGLSMDKPITVKTNNGDISYKPSGKSDEHIIFNDTSVQVAKKIEKYETTEQQFIDGEWKDVKVEKEREVDAVDENGEYEYESLKTGSGSKGSNKCDSNSTNGECNSELQGAGGNGGEVAGEDGSSMLSFSSTGGINIANPATLSKYLTIEDNADVVRQTVTEDDKGTFNLQVGVPTKIIPTLAAEDSIYLTSLSVAKRKSYIKYYYYKFDFPITSETDTVVKEFDAKDGRYYYYISKVVDTNAAIDELYSDSRGAVTIIPTGEEGQKSMTEYLGIYYTTNVTMRKNNIWAYAATKDIPGGVDEVVKYIKSIDSGENEEKGITLLECSETPKYTTNNEKLTTLLTLGDAIRYDVHYVSNSTASSTTNLSRIYGFRVTDCTDVNFKDVFRKSVDGVNEHTGNIYYSGIRVFEVYKDHRNAYVDITSPEIGSNENMILPLGPYKQDGGYVDAPKLGYRISFDLKTSGLYDIRGNSGQNRTIVIFPTFYYVSKDGDFNFNVDAYYKNASGKYQKIPQIGGEPTKEDYTNTRLNGYKITYIPNDGYRNVLNLGITDVEGKFTKERVSLDMSTIVLTLKNMCTNDDGFVQSWYGEYKLPNSTILVKSGKKNLNGENQLKNGYLGVIFNIGVVEKDGSGTVIMSYNVPDKNKSGPNTTQWDYEGYLGFKNPGTSADGQNLKLKFASTTINVDNDLYQKIKGTVILYDLDNRAASDFE